MIINDISCAQYRNTVPRPVTYVVPGMSITITHSTEVISGERFQNSNYIIIVISPVVVSGKNKDEIPCFTQNNHYRSLKKNLNAPRPSGVVVVVFSHQLIRYESSRGHKIDGTKPNKTGNRR